MCYTIQQAAEKMGITAHTLRYYERIDLLPPIARAENGHRRYTKDDLGWVHFLNLLRNTGMSIQQMQAYIQLARLGDMTVPERLELLSEHRERIVEQIHSLQTHLGALERKIAHYQALKDGTPPPPC